MSHESSSFDPDERRREALMDGSGRSNFDADIALDKIVLPGTTETPTLHIHIRRPHVSHRGGRSYPEKSGRDITREIDNKAALEEPFVPTPESEAIKNASLDEMRSILLAQKVERIIADGEASYNPDAYDPAHTEEDIQRQNAARLRTLIERDNKR